MNEPAREAHRSIVVGFSPGSSTDIVARVVAQKPGELRGQQAIVDNRPGANIAANVVSKAAPDGDTLLDEAISTPPPGSKPGLKQRDVL